MSSSTMPDELADGYNRFVSKRAEEQQNLYRELGQGQAPHTLVISCADSRVDPATIFGAGPGELFVIRNVANIVPPPSAYGDDPKAPLAGTAAALEFAVDHLRVSRIVVMGHAKCGGVAAALGQAQKEKAERDTGPGQAAGEDQSSPSYISRWVGLMAEDGTETVMNNLAMDQDGLQQCLEHQNVRSSLERIQGFPFIRKAMDERGLTLHGAWFSIAAAELFWMQDNGEFLSVEDQG